MRKSYLRAIALLFLLAGTFFTKVNAQCALSGSYWGEVLPNNGCAAFANYSPFGPGQYVRMPVLLGGSYTVSTCGAGIDTQITGYQGTSPQVFYNDDNGPDCTGLAASATYTSTFTDYLRCQINQYNCQPGGSASITVKVRQNNNLTVTTSNTPMCQGQSRGLTASPARVTTTPFTGSGDVGTFTGTGVSGTTFTAPTPSTSSATYTHTYTFGYCTATRTIDVFRSPSTSNAGSDQTVCSQTVTLSGNNPTYGTGTWTVVSGTGTITSPSSAGTTVTGIPYGTSITLRWTISNGPCAVSTDDVVITVQSQPTTSNAGPDQNVCATTASLSANTPTSGSGLWTLVGGTGTITNPTSPTSGVTGLGTGSNTFRWTITNGACSPSTDDVVITRDGLPTTAIAGPNQAFCGSSTMLAGNSPSVGTGTWTVLSGTATITTPNSPSSSVTGIAVGSAQLVWTISNGSCPASSDTVVLTRNAAPANPTISGVVNVCIGNTTSLVATSVANQPTYEWYDAPTGGTLLSSTSGYTTPPVTTTDTFYVKVTDGMTGCESAREMVIVSPLALPVVSLGPDTTVCAADTLCISAGAGFSSYTWSTGGSGVTECIVGGGNVVVTVTDQSGCNGSDTLVINTTAAPVVNLGPDTSYCAGTSISIGLGSNPGSSYVWNTGDTTSMISIGVVGTYTLTETNANGCTGSDNITVSEDPNPVAAFTSNTSGCPIVTFDDGSTDASSYFWTFGDGTNSSSQNPTHDYTAAGNGTYTVTLIATGDCGADTSVQTVVINCLVGSAQPADGPEVSVVPNPNAGQFRLDATGLPNEKFVLNVYNAVGQLVYTWSSNDHQGSVAHQISLDQPAGIYYAKVLIGKSEITRRVIIQR